MGEHLVEPHHRYRQGQHDPEQPAELPDVITMAPVSAVAMSGMRGVIMLMLVGAVGGVTLGGLCCGVHRMPVVRLRVVLA
ncbi:hypothetical protein GCM10009771_02190 [Nesterenkonia flava]